MASHPSSQSTEEVPNLGFGAKVVEQSTLRLLNRDGSFNVSRDGLAFWESVHLYRTLLKTPWWNFILILFGSFIGINVLFGLLYALSGQGALTGAGAGASSLGMAERFLSAFFFSVHTITTVGFGHIAPHNLMADVLVTVEAFLGLSGFALVAGLIFARFEQPHAKLLFSDKAVVGANGEFKTFKLRMANGGQNELLAVQIRVLLCMTETIDGIRRRKFHQLVLDRRKTTFLPLDWTVVHTISQDSPLYDLTENDLRERDAEFLILVDAIDDTSSQPVHARSSYKWQEVVWDAQFRDMYRTTRDGRMSVDLRRMHDIEETQIRQQAPDGVGSVSFWALSCGLWAMGFE